MSTQTEFEPSLFGTEAFFQLLDLAQAERLPPALAEALAAQAIRVTRGSDFAVARDAMEALLRRLVAARQV